MLVATSAYASTDVEPAEEQRFERPESGYALTLPAGWIGMDSSGADIEGLLVSVEDHLDGPEDAERLRRLLDLMADALARGGQVAATRVERSSTLLCSIEANYLPEVDFDDWVSFVAANIETCLLYTSPSPRD